MEEKPQITMRDLMESWKGAAEHWETEAKYWKNKFELEAHGHKYWHGVATVAMTIAASILFGVIGACVGMLLFR